MSENRNDPLKNTKNSSNQNPIISKHLPNLSTNNNGNNANAKINRNGVLQKSDNSTLFNVYADDPLQNANIIRLNQSPLIIENPSTRVLINNETKNGSSSYERRRFSVNSSNHQLPHLNDRNFAKHNGYGTPDAISFNLTNSNIPQKKTFLQNQKPINHRNRLSFDEFDVKKGTSRFIDSEHFHTPSTSSSSSGK